MAQAFGGRAVHHHCDGGPVIQFLIDVGEEVRSQMRDLRTVKRPGVCHMHRLSHLQQEGIHGHLAGEAISVRTDVAKDNKLIPATDQVEDLLINRGVTEHFRLHG
jgi:hypothetical protein